MTDLKGYDMIPVDAKCIQKNKYLLSTEIEEKTGREELNEKILEVLKARGKTFFFKKKKKVCGVAIVKVGTYQKENEPEVAAYLLDGLYLDPDLQTKDKILMVDVVDELKDEAAYTDPDLKIRAIVWGEEVADDGTIGKVGPGVVARYQSLGMSMGVCFGCLLGMLLFNNLAIGVAVGLCFGTASGLGLGSAKYKKALKDAGVEEK